MKNLLLLASVSVISIIVSGCVNSGTEPQKVVLHQPEGGNLIVKNMFDLPVVQNKQLGQVLLSDVFSTEKDKVKTDYNIAFFEIQPGMGSAIYQIKSPQCIVSVSGSGKLQVNLDAISLKKGLVVYIPADTTLSIINDTPKKMMFLAIGSPPFKLEDIQVTGKPPGKSFLNNNNKKKTVVKPKAETSQPGSIFDETAPVPKDIKNQLNMDKFDKELDKTFKDPMDDPMSYPLNIPDNSEIKLDEILKEQPEQLLPKKPQEEKKTDLKQVKEKSIKDSESELDQLLKEQPPAASQENADLKQVKEDSSLKNESEKLLPSEPQQIEKTDMNQVQELTPADTESKFKLDSSAKKQSEDLLPSEPQQIKKTDLKQVQELTPSDSKTKSNSLVKQPEELLPKKPQKGEKTDLQQVQELTPSEEKEISASTTDN
ncbi:MAG: hypothetical protein GY750_02310 [Lentisphaerae bacterium]|nr:hypothetical protein [Lentisphaerota bacterium]MCP4100254.1 hypothetical protein [Lentisphaerota bacterium]